MSQESNGKSSVDQKVVGIKRKCSCCKCVFWSFSFIVAGVAVLVGYVYFQLRDRSIPAEIAQHLGAEGIQLFYAYDRDNDGYLSITEFEALYHRLSGQNENFSVSLDDYNQTLDDTDELVTVTAYFEPLVLESLSRATENGAGIDIRKDDVLHGLRTWKKPNHEWMNFGVQHFKSFFPPDGYIQSFSKVYPILMEDGGILSMIQIDLSSNRYFPPVVKENHVIFHRLLAMFHRYPFVLTRFKPRGGFAIVRAVSEEYIDIVFRFHAEFQLQEPPQYPFWFTPGQFKGNLIISTDLKHILHFQMYVPSKRKLNVDMEWLYKNNNMEVDIGYLPLMVLNITAPSVPVSEVDVDNKVPDKPCSVEDIIWNKQISQAEAESLLELEMFPFKKVEYHNFNETFSLAQKENKLVHAVLLWGALDDQSC